MKCKDCGKSLLAICPECGNKVIICKEDDDLPIIKYWHWNEDDGIFCDGVMHNND